MAAPRWGHRRLTTSLFGAAVLAAAATACGGGTGGGGAGVTDGGVCDLAALDGVTEPVAITFWHAMTAANQTELAGLAAQFNAAQQQVHVDLVAQPSYQELFTKYKAGLTSGDLPDLMQAEETTVQALIDSKSTVPAQECVDENHTDLTDYVPRALDYYTVGGALQSMPFNVSNPVLLYDRVRFQAAGLDPDAPPATLDEVRAAAQQIVDAGVAAHGVALHVEPFVMEFLYAKSGIPYVDEGGGRTARATEALLDSPDGEAIWAWWQDMVASGLALDTGAEPGSIDHLLAIGTGDAVMTFDASGVLGPVYEVLSSGQFEGVDIGVGPLPALRPGGGVPVGDGSLWLPKASSPLERAAAWRFVTFVDAPEQQAALSVASRGGYVPVRTSAADDAALRALWAERPGLRVPYDQLLAGNDDPAASGSVIGDYQGVRDAVRDAMVAMLTGGLAPADAVARADSAADAAIAAYNARVG